MYTESLKQMKKEIAILIKFLEMEVAKSSYRKLAKKLEMPTMTLYSVINDKRAGSVNTWEKIEQYYRKESKHGTRRNTKKSTIEK